MTQLLVWAVAIFIPCGSLFCFLQLPTTKVLGRYFAKNVRVKSPFSHIITNLSWMRLKINWSSWNCFGNWKYDWCPSFFLNLYCTWISHMFYLLLLCSFLFILFLSLYWCFWVHLSHIKCVGKKLTGLDLLCLLVVSFPLIRFLSTPRGSPASLGLVTSMRNFHWCQNQ